MRLQDEWRNPGDWSWFVIYQILGIQRVQLVGALIYVITWAVIYQILSIQRVHLVGSLICVIIWPVIYHKLGDRTAHKLGDRTAHLGGAWICVIAWPVIYHDSMCSNSPSSSSVDLCDYLTCNVPETSWPNSPSGGSVDLCDYVTRNKPDSRYPNSPSGRSVGFCDYVTRFPDIKMLATLVAFRWWGEWICGPGIHQISIWTWHPIRK